MTGKLRRGPLPRTESIRLTIALPAAVKANLDRYAELYGAAYGEVVDATALVPHMLAAFMERDRAFRKARQDPATASRTAPGFASINAASSSTSETAGEPAASR